MSVTTLNSSPASCLRHNYGIIPSFVWLPESLPIRMFLDTPTYILRYVLRSSVVSELDQQLRDCNEALALYKAHLDDVQSRMNFTMVSGGTM